MEKPIRLSLLVVLALALLPFVQGASPEFASYDFAKPVLDSFVGRLPARLDASTWNDWNRRNDQEIRSRLETGDLDSLVNLLLYGTSFTKQPRISLPDLAALTRSGVLKSRVNDLVRGLASPGSNERLAILRSLVLRKGFELDSPEGQGKAGTFILENLTRVLEEKRTFAARSAAAVDSATGATPSTLVERSELFHDRGVSLDTGILADFSVDLALRSLKERGVLKPGQVARVAVIGPGLSFIDKDELAAFDYFPLQTVQPFALIDSLLQADLAEEAKVSLTALDISPLLLGHFQRARQSAEHGAGYVIQLPQDVGRSWPPALVKYWRGLGDRVGLDVKPLAPPAVFAGLQTRAVRVRPQVVLACQAVDLDMIAQHLTLAAAPGANDRFDLVVATNVFLYYDGFQQALAVQNVASMLKPGGLLLANDDLRLLEASGMRRVNVTAISDGAAGRDAVAAYQKQ